MGGSRYLIGIDLGTSNCAVAYVDTRARTRREALAVTAWDIPQLVRPGVFAATGERELPSAIYFPRAGELPPGAAALPWSSDAKHVVGAAARLLGERCPDQLVASAKSWLAHARVDRRGKILPWCDPPEEISRISCVEAARLLLAHLAAAWNHAHARHKDARFEAQRISLAVPASFDEAARALTVEAARAAGFEDFRLIEEPQAAFYAYLAEHRLRWRETLAPGTRVLVCDVGGGTTDFSLFDVGEAQGELAFARAAVGPHLLLGGDNLDLALAREVEAGWRANGVSGELDARDLAALVAQCRRAKETLLGEGASERTTVQLHPRSARLIGGTRTAELVREAVLARALDGFLPVVPLEAKDDGARRGLVEWGLPYEADGAITRHLARFLCRSGTAGAPARPDLVLFQGGFFAPAVLRHRLAQVAGGFFGRPALGELASVDLARSVALGAAYHGLVLAGHAVAITGGTSRAYYVGVEGGSARAGRRPRALCLAPRGLDSHVPIRSDAHPLAARTGQPVRFRFYAAEHRSDAAGDLVDADGLDVLPPLETRLPASGRDGGELPVVLEATLSEVGTLELALVARKGGRRFVLELDVRGGAPPDEPVGSDADVESAPRSASEEATPRAAGAAEPSPDRLARAVARLRAVLGAADVVAVARLGKALEEDLACARREWSLACLRALGDALLDVAPTRSASAAHELRWLNLAGYGLRPGAGHATDPERMRRLWPLAERGLVHERDVAARCEWWVLWRRVALGLTAGQQAELAKPLVRALAGPETLRGRELASRAGKGERIEALRLASSLERIERPLKEVVGGLLVHELDGRDGIGASAVWCLGRLGARAPLAAADHAVLPPAVVQPWVERLLARVTGSDEAYALGSIARLTGDRARDLPQAVRERVTARLAGAGYDEEARAVREVVDVDRTQQQRAFGEALPDGLVMG